MKPVRVVGAGFSGLTLAHALQRQGVPVEVIERESRIGGLIESHNTPEGLVESAANALLASQQVEDLFRELKLEFAPTLPARKARYIFWQKARRWPLDFTTTLQLSSLLFRRSEWQPKAGESVAAWARRLVNPQFLERLVAPALQGIYAGDCEQLSASLILGRWFASDRSVRDKLKGKLRGSVAPRGGMGELLERLRADLVRRGVRFELNRGFTLEPIPTEPVVLATSVWGAAQILHTHFPRAAELLGRCESLPLISVTTFFNHQAEQLQGFGCLFPRSQGFHALGVLFNDCIFAGRSKLRSETWIFGGALNPEVLQLNEKQLLEQLLNDRRRLPGASKEPPKAVHFKHWTRALPHYTLRWESVLQKLSLPKPIYLHGNYLGALGLTQILARSNRLAREIKEAHFG
jgi:oxygen-dependent protoporphyrinogen oxidase